MCAVQAGPVAQTVSEPAPGSWRHKDRLAHSRPSRGRTECRSGQGGCPADCPAGEGVKATRVAKPGIGRRPAGDPGRALRDSLGFYCFGKPIRCSGRANCCYGTPHCCSGTAICCSRVPICCSGRADCCCGRAICYSGIPICSSERADCCWGRAICCSGMPICSSGRAICCLGRANRCSGEPICCSGKQKSFIADFRDAQPKAAWDDAFTGRRPAGCPGRWRAWHPARRPRRRRRSGGR